MEPFVGGGSVLQRVAPHFATVAASDACEDLILLYQALQAGWVPPSELTKAEYDALKTAEPSALRAFAGFGCSFGAKWFGGYARGDNRNFADESSRNLLQIARVVGHVSFRHGDYRGAPVDGDTVVYCDPPYADTTGYTAVGAFDHGEFWQTMQAWADLGAAVLVSEYSCPLK